jgi:GGDEF domain-containing protein
MRGLTDHVLRCKFGFRTLAFKVLRAYVRLAVDVALQEVARTLAGALRPSDSVGRWGGGEFLAIVRNMNSEVLNAAFNSLRN